MSLRQKRKSQSINQPSGSNAVRSWKVFFVAMALVFIVAWVTYGRVLAHLESVEFREKLAQSLSPSVGAPLRLEKLHWSGLHLETEGGSAASAGALQRLEVKGVQLDVDVDYLKREFWELSDLEIESVSVMLDLTKEFSVIEPIEEPATWYQKYLPEAVKLHGAKVGNTEATVVTEAGSFSFQGGQVAVEGIDAGYDIALTGGQIATPYSYLREIRLDDAKLKFLGDTLVVERANLHGASSGSVTLEGELEIESGAYAFQGELTGLQLQDLVSADWKQRMSGALESRFFTTSSMDGASEELGSVEVLDGTLTALPILDTIASYTGISGFKTLRFDQLKGDFRRSGGMIRLTNIAAYCEGLVRIEGDLSIEGKALDGDFRVGVLSAALQKIPGAEGQVFIPGAKGLSWANVKVTGTTDHIEEDLSARLKAAALGRLLHAVGAEHLGGDAAKLIDTITDSTLLESANALGKDSLKEGFEVLGDSALEQPAKVGAGLIESGLDGLFGKPPRKKAEKQ